MATISKRLPRIFSRKVAALYETGDFMTFPSGDGLRRIGDERRSAACLKACEGIPTELLEGGIILKLVAACVHVSDHRVREVLEELAMHRLRHADRESAARTSRRLMSSAPPGR
ncbi:MAG TPA: hypothetical protein VGK70_13740 [Thermoanaerobaculia bacterium]